MLWSTSAAWAQEASGAAPAEGLEGFVVGAFVFGLFLVMSPAINAFRRGHHQKWPILLTTMLLSWTVIGWFVALIWSWSAVKKTDEQGRIE